MNSTEATQRRLSLGLSKYAVAKALGCSWQHYHLYERGERKLSASKMQILTAILGNYKPYTITK